MRAIEKSDMRDCVTENAQKKKPRVPALVNEDPAAATCAILVSEFMEE